MKRLLSRWQRGFYLLALSLYVVALGVVIFVFPGVSNLWVSIFILVSGFFSLLADYASTEDEQEEKREQEPYRPRLLIVAPTYREAAQWVSENRDRIGHRRFTIINDPEHMRGLTNCEVLIVRYPRWLDVWTIQLGRHTIIDERLL